LGFSFEIKAALVEDKERYPDSLKVVLEENAFQNILDSNIFSAYIADEISVPRIDDPRKTQISREGVPRHPGYVRSAQINQVFTYIGFIKRADNKAYREYVPLLFKELKRFLRIFEEIVYTLDVTIPQEIYVEQKDGFENFVASYDAQTRNRIAWIENIWKHQKIYLENMDMLLETLKLRGLVFDCKEDPLYEKIVTSCKDSMSNSNLDHPGDMDFNFVANCCSMAARDNVPKTIWSGDFHIVKILRTLYSEKSGLKKDLPEIFLRASYGPRGYAQLFP
jgi:hypothetical protein